LADAESFNALFETERFAGDEEESVDFPHGTGQAQELSDPDTEIDQFELNGIELSG
jgi:hypothetical protein